VLIGFGALGAETGVWFTIKLRNQSAADPAAIAGGYEIMAGKTDITTALTPAAGEAAARNGYNGAAPTVIYPYSDAFVSNGVAVTLRETVDAALASMFVSRVSVGTKAVAVSVVLDNPCVLALGASGTELEIQPSTHLDMPNCWCSKLDRRERHRALRRHEFDNRSDTGHRGRNLASGKLDLS
jgi:hypothetical protein